MPHLRPLISSLPPLAAHELTLIDSLIKLVVYPFNSTSSLSIPLCASLLVFSTQGRSTPNSFPLTLSYHLSASTSLISPVWSAERNCRYWWYVFS